MNTIKKINTFAIALPFVIAVFAVLNENLLIIAILSTMVTGFIQVLISLYLLVQEPRNKHLQIYLGIVLLFFGLWFINVNYYYSDELIFLLFALPVALTFYLTLIIHKNLKL
ncbi:hypothetical protein [Flavobacterium turcicum]|uniref:Uncharacterized protein n=1 Tax=Flavobacterium turcicum TaxID=2764718 RepID=A0ABR7JI09_9FLAO|nr:hypothetical protein [Flavobacterium turcicum]MBC5864134.1 hypothetical protein [Flavobacterium turcicum]NHL03040.1 hypothetical protein [Flavobacterium turcicum]